MAGLKKKRSEDFFEGWGPKIFEGNYKISCRLMYTQALREIDFCYSHSYKKPELFLISIFHCKFLSNMWKAEVVGPRTEIGRLRAEVGGRRAEGRELRPAKSNPYILITQGPYVGLYIFAYIAHVQQTNKQTK